LHAQSVRSGLSREYTLNTGASNHNVSAVLSQVQEGWEVIAYYSKALSAAEKNYCTTRKKLLAVIKAVKHFRPYLYGRVFRLRTDHASLIWLRKKAKPSSQVARWLEIMAEFFYRIEHRHRKKHGNAGGLSRRPDGGCRRCLSIKRRTEAPCDPSWRHCLAMERSTAGSLASWYRYLVKVWRLYGLRANLVLADNISELRKLQETLPGVVADVY